MLLPSQLHAVASAREIITHVGSDECKTIADTQSTPWPALVKHAVAIGASFGRRLHMKVRRDNCAANASADRHAVASARISSL